MHRRRRSPKGAGPAGPGVGESARAFEFAGRIVETDDWRWALLIDDPAPGTAFLAAEGPFGDEKTSTVSVWTYLYGPDRASLAERDEPRWSNWLATVGDG